MTHVVIVGAGIYGAGTALALRDAGVDVTVVEARTPGHAWAGSGGLSRVLRYEYGRDLLYVRLAALARDAWRALEARLGVTLYHETGILTLAASASSWERESFDALVAAGYHPEPLSAAEVTRRWPVISADGIGFAAYHAIGGFIAARRATEAIAATAESAGARFVRGAAVAGVVVEHGRAQGVQLASGERIAADAVVLAPGAWAAATLFNCTGKLGKGQDRDLELTGHGFERARDFGRLLDEVVGRASVGRIDELEVVDDDETEVFL